MAATITSGPAVVQLSTVPTTRMSSTTIQLDASYPTGGYTITPGQLGLSNVGLAQVTAGTVDAAANTAVQWVYTASTQKLQGFTAAGEEPNATVETNQLVQVLAVGY